MSGKINILGSTPSGAPIVSFGGGAQPPAPPPAHLANLPVTLDHIPDADLADHLRYILTAPQLFSEIGEADRYFAFLSQWIDYLHTFILQNPPTPRSLVAADIVASKHNFIPIYFTQSNVRDLLSKRGDIIDFALRQAGYPIDHTFPPRTSGSKIKLGILAAHFNPAPETFAALAVFEHLRDADENFEITLYSTFQTNHRLEKYCASRANSFKLLPKDPPAQVAAIRNDNLDILFIATNVTAVFNNTVILAAHRLARHQTTSIASVVTTGLPNIDSYISSSLTDASSDAPSHYRERLLLINGPIHCFTHGPETNTASMHPTRDTLQIPAAATLFASGANVYKIIPELRLTWAKILAEIPDSFLLLYPYGPNWSDTYAKEAFQSQFAQTLRAHNVDPTRLRILDPKPTPNRDDIKEFLKLADIYLDSHPFAGSTSIIDPLEVALPPIVRSGKFLRSNMSAALLTNLGLPELIASTESDYITLAISLAKNPGVRQNLSKEIRTRMNNTPTFLNPKSYAQKLAPIFKSLLNLPPHT